MAYTHKILAQGTSTGTVITTFTTIYTVPSGKTVIINQLALCNAGVSGTTNVQVRIVPSGASSSAAHNIGPATSQGRSSVVIAQQICLSAGDFVQIATDSANVINYYIGGIEIT